MPIQPGTPAVPAPGLHSSSEISDAELGSIVGERLQESCAIHQQPLVPCALYWGVPNHLLPFLGTVAAVALALREGIPLEVHGVTITMGLLAGLGITLGFHRLFTHHAFQTFTPIVWTLAVLGCMAGQSSMFFWVSEHRRHHRHSDGDGDPHSPKHGGFWHAHVGWLLGRAYTWNPREIPDLVKRKDLAWIDRHTFFWYVAGLLLPAVVCGLVSGSAYGALLGFLWGGLLRQFVLQQITYSVNSASHLWGSQDYPSDDGSRNNWLVGLLALGEGWHNNHHAFPYSARHGLRWWQLDLSWYIIWAMERLGLAWNVRLPPAGEPGGRS